MSQTRQYNTDIDISSFKVIDDKISESIESEFFRKFKNIPEEFNWAFILANDDSDLIKKKRLISDVKNQHLCGCCWAISTATSISDCFVVKGLVNWSPKVSYTYALARYPQQKCSGGSARILLEDIKNGDGITSEYCVDESWCLNNKYCISKKPSDHFQSRNKEFLSSLIPSVGCFNGNNKHYIYKIDDVYSMSISDPLKVLETQTKIKQHIMIRGPVVGGLIIMDNFPSGNFTHKGSGIYFENGEYNPAKEFVYSFGKDNIVGSHSVVIMGWGVAKNVRYENITTNVPYWYCRNSWGKEWGENGYFKIAMYPFNKVSQFEKRVRVLHNKKVKEVGGVTGFNVTQLPELMFIPENNMSKFSKLKKDLVLYTTDENLIHAGGDISSIATNLSYHKKEANKKIMYLAAVVAIIMLLKEYIHKN